MALTIKFLENDAVDKVLDFFNKEKADKLRFNDRKKKEFEWMFFDGYYKSALYTVASESETNEIVGSHAGILIPMVSPKGEKVITMKGEDTMISFDRMIKYGKRDILVEMYKFLEMGAAEENVSFIWGFSPLPSAFRRCGSMVSGQVKGSFLVLRPFMFYSLRLKMVGPGSIKRKVLLISFALTNYFFQSIANIQGSKFSCKSVNLDNLDFLKIKEFFPENSYSLWLDREFLEWRIERNPSGVKYGFLEFNDKNGVIIAYVIYSENADKVFYIEQLLFDKNLNNNEKSGILNGTKRYFLIHDAVMVRAMGFSHNTVNTEEMKLLKKTGFHFFTSQEPSYFLFKNIKDRGVRMDEIYVSRLNTQGVV